MKRLILMLALALSVGATIPVATAGCATVHTNVSPVADIANAGAKLQESAHVIFESAKTANATINPSTGQPIVSRPALDQVAMAVNKVGHLGLDLKAALDAYNAAKAAGADLTAQRAVVGQVLNALTQALQDIGRAIPPGIVQQIDQAASVILGVIAQVKGAVL